MNKVTALPATIVTVLLTAAFGLISLLHTIANKPILFVDYWLNARGIDFQVFFRAAENIVHGQNPYAVAMNYNRYVYTPIPALANILFVPMGFDNARILLYVLIPLSLVFGYLSVTAAFGLPPLERKHVLLAGLVCLLFGYPSYFLIQRENIDGWVFMFLCAGLFFSQKEKMLAWSGLFLALAIAFKIYPVLIILPVLLYRRWRLLFLIGLWLALLVGISAFWHSGFRSGLAGRLTDFELRGNGSLFAAMIGVQNLCAALGIPAPNLLTKFPMEIAAVTYGVLIAVVIFVDYRLGRAKKYEIGSATLYVPFMIAWPRLVYPYAFVVCAMLIPTICHLWRTSQGRLQNTLLVILAVGVSLSQWQAFGVYNLTGSDLAYAIPGFGLFIMMAGIALYKLLALRAVVPESSGTIEKPGIVLAEHTGA